MKDKKKREGVAMIMVLAMLVIFAALIVAVVISSTTAIRRAHFYKDKNTALQIALAGIQDTLYWMNYKGYSYHNYPCTQLPSCAYNPDYKYFQGSDYTGSDTWTNMEPLNYNPSFIPQGRCVVTFTDSNQTNEDIITATGYYKGRDATVSVKLRGNSGDGNASHNNNTGRFLSDWDGYGLITGVATWGIPEAFNKHTIYAREVECATGTGNKPQITGNIFTYNTINLNFAATSQYTLTKIPSIEVPSYFDNFTKPDTEIFRQGLPSGTVTPAVYFIHPVGYPVDKVYAYANDDTTYNDTVLGHPNGVVNGISYSSAANEYTFTNTRIDYSFSVLGEGGNGNARFNHSNLIITQPFRIVGNLTIDNNNLTINYRVEVGGNLQINQPITTDTNKQSIFYVTGGVTLSNTVTGDFVVRRASSVNIGGTINGALILDEIQGNVNTNAPSYISVNASSSNYKSGVFINTKGNIGSISAPVSPLQVNSLTIGSNQQAGIVAYSSEGNVYIFVSPNRNIFCEKRIAIAAYSEKGTSQIDLGPDIGNINVKGLIYNRGLPGTPSIINIAGSNTTPEIKGALVTNGKVYFKL
ncbi:MAG: hypothetical protein N3D17_07280, partial [bacterium]|nr:hypothetical protein [bacterium]